MITQFFLHKFWLFNEFENAAYSVSDAAVFKYVLGLVYKSNAHEIQAVIDMVMILNFFELLLSNSEKFKIITISTTHHNYSAFDLHLNPNTYRKYII